MTDQKTISKAGLRRCELALLLLVLLLLGLALPLQPERGGEDRLEAPDVHRQRVARLDLRLHLLDLVLECLLALKERINATLEQWSRNREVTISRAKDLWKKLQELEDFR